MKFEFLEETIDTDRIIQKLKKPQLPTLKGIVKKIDIPKKEAFVLLMIAFIAMGIRLENFSDFKYPIQELDPYFHARITRSVIENGLIPREDPQGFYSIHMPYQAEIHPYIMGFLYKFITLNGPYSDQLFMPFYSLYPVIVTAFTCLFAYLFIRETNGRFAGLLSAFAVAVMPRLIYKGAYGVAEDDPFGLLMILVAMYFYALAVKKPSIPRCARAGLVLSLALASWTGMGYLTYLIVGFLVLQPIVDIVHGKSTMYLIKTSFFSLFGLVPGMLFFTYFPELTNSARWTIIDTSYSFFVFALFFGAFFWSTLLEYLRFRRAELQRPLQISAALFCIGLLIKGPSILFSPFSNITELQESGRTRVASMADVIMQTIAEQIGSISLDAFIDLFNVAMWLFIFSLALLFYRTFMEKDSLDLFLLIMSASSFFIAAQRTAYLFIFSLPICLCFGVALDYIWKESEQKFKGDIRKTALGVVGVFLIAEASAGVGFGSAISSYLSTPWLEALEFMRYDTPDNSSFISWWDYGHWTTFIADRKAVNDNRQLGGVDIIHGTAKFFTDIDEDTAIQYLKNNSIDYVITDNEIVIGGPRFGVLQSDGSTKYWTEDGYLTQSGASQGKRGAIITIANGYNETPDVYWKRSMGRFQCLRTGNATFKCTPDLVERLGLSDFNSVLDTVTTYIVQPGYFMKKNQGSSGYDSYDISYMNHVYNGFCCKIPNGCPEYINSQIITNETSNYPPLIICAVENRLSLWADSEDMDEISKLPGGGAGIKNFSLVRKTFPGALVQGSEFGIDGEYYAHLVDSPELRTFLGTGKRIMYQRTNRDKTKTNYNITVTGMDTEGRTVSLRVNDGTSSEEKTLREGEEGTFLGNLGVKVTVIDRNYKQADIQIGREYWDLYLETPGAAKEMLSRLFFNDTTLAHFQLIFANAQIRIHKVLYD